MTMSPHIPWSGPAPFPAPELPREFDRERPSSFFTEWATGVTPDESRQRPRRSVQCEVLMTEPGWWETENPLPIRGECRNLSQDGLYAVVPVGYGLAVGQRYLFHLRWPDGRDDPVSQQGTIVRTQVLLGQGDDQIGIGVRLNGPLS
jgi:hypothetical protein